MVPKKASAASASARRSATRPSSGIFQFDSTTPIIRFRRRNASRPSGPRDCYKRDEGAMEKAEGTTTSGLYWCTLGNGPAVLVLHGGPGADHGYLLPQFATLADDLRLVFYDQRGGGRSRAGTPTPTVSDHLADLGRLASALAPEPLRLVRHPRGALVGRLNTL